MPDREAFVSAIAANPADDLPRLVFADWLDEHGDPDRAEFIRTQIRWHHALPDERKYLDARAADLFRDHWQRWFGPFLHALDPNARPDVHFVIAKGHEFISVRTPYGDSPLAVVGLDVCRGFVQGVELYLDNWGEQSSLADAFRMEPLTHLACHDGLHSPVWSRFTDPALRRVSVLHLEQFWAWDVSAPESTALLEDPHLAGVREFSVLPDNNGVVSLPVAWVERFVRSSLAYRLTDLSLNCLPAGGVIPLCRPGRLQLNKLSLYGSLTADDMRRLGASELSRTVAELELGSELNDATIAALARDEWPKLTNLNLNGNDLTAAVLPALAAAEFLPRLKVLVLSNNWLFDGTDLSGLQRLADALDPERLECLDLLHTGLSHVPDFLAERFGDRVVV